MCNIVHRFCNIFKDQLPNILFGVLQLPAIWSAWNGLNNSTYQRKYIEHDLGITTAIPVVRSIDGYYISGLGHTRTRSNTCVCWTVCSSGWPEWPLRLGWGTSPNAELPRGLPVKHLAHTRCWLSQIIQWRREPGSQHGIFLDFFSYHSYIEKNITYRQILFASNAF